MVQENTLITPEKLIQQIDNKGKKVDVNDLMPPPASHNCKDLVVKIWDQFIADTSNLRSTG